MGVESNMKNDHGLDVKMCSCGWLVPWAVGFRVRPRGLAGSLLERLGLEVKAVVDATVICPLCGTECEVE